MRAAWLLAGLAVAVPAGALLLARRKPSTPVSGGATTTPASAKTPASEPQLTPALTDTLREWLDSLDVDNLGKPEHKAPSSEVIAGATSFANQLEQAGYTTEANALRVAVQIAVSQEQPTGGLA
jgi:hypothetical protein